MTSLKAPKVQILPLRRVANTGRPTNGETEYPTPAASIEGFENGSTAQPARRTRTSKPKVRTGCQTCKIRRVKCDETKPECTKCTSTGRVCDGYNIIPRKKPARKPKPLEPSRSLQTVKGSPDELRALDFFHSRTAPSLASYFDLDFWGGLVLQISASEPAIKHALVAVGTLHESRELGTTIVPMTRSVVIRDPCAMSVPITKTASDNNGPFALAQYNKSITHLNRRLNEADTSVEIALLACILFVCVEFLRGDVEPAINHFRAGMSIANAAVAKSGSKTAKASLARIKDHMFPFFNRLEILSALFGNDAEWRYQIDILQAVPTTFQTLQEARNSTVHLMNHGLRFIRSMKISKYDRTVSTKDLADQEQLCHEINTWHRNLERFLAQPTTPLTPKDQQAANVLQIHMLVTLIWIQLSTVPEETTSDRFTPQFARVVSLAESVIATQPPAHPSPLSSSCGPRPPSSTFLFDMEIVSPLYFVCIKCRHPQLRRRAIAILRASSRREGLWDSNMAASVGERQMQIEEVGLEVLDGSQMPAEAVRVHNIWLQSDGGLNPRSHWVTFHTKPGGMGSYWKVWQERIWFWDDVEGREPPMGVGSSFAPLRDAPDG